MEPSPVIYEALLGKAELRLVIAVIIYILRILFYKVGRKKL